MLDDDKEKLELEAPQLLRKPLLPATKFPVDSLPPLLRAAVLGMHDKLQVAIPICAQSILSASNLAVQGHANVMMPFGQERPISCYFITIARTGERKTTCDNEALQAVKEYEKELDIRRDIELREWRNKRDIYERQRRRILRGNTPDPLLIADALKAIGDTPREPLHSLITCPEPTYEGLCKLMINSRPCLGIFSSEGGQFLTGYGMKDENKVATAGGLSSIWDNGNITRIRSIDGVNTIRGRRLCIHLMVQPEIVSSFLHDSKLQGQGLLSRMLISAADSNIADTDSRHKASPTSIEAISNFHKAIGLLLRINLNVTNINQLEPRVIHLNHNANRIYEDYANYTNSRRGKDGDYEPINAFANKYPEYAVRLATSFALMDDVQTLEVEGKYLEMARDIMLYYAEEALRLMDGGKIPNDIIIAEQLYRWMRSKWRKKYITLREVYRNGIYTVRTKADALKMMLILEDHEYVMKCEVKDKWEIRIVDEM